MTTETNQEDTKVAPKYSQEELLEIFDEILFQGSYQEDIKLRGKLVVTFRTRSADDTASISRKLDAKQYQLSSTYMEHRALLNLASSLITYNGKDYANHSLDDRFTFVNKLPAHLVSLLSTALVDFDSKVEAACKDSEENF